MIKKCFVTFLAAAAVLSAMLSCGPSNKKYGFLRTNADTLLTQAIHNADYQRELELCDSLEKTGDITPIRAACHRGSAYEAVKNYRLAKEVLNLALAMKPADARDSSYYFRCVSTLVEVLAMTNDHEGVLRVAVPVIEKLDDTDQVNLSVIAFLSNWIGTAQQSLGMENEAAVSFERCYNLLMKYYTAFPSWQNIGNTILSAYNIFGNYVATGNYETSGEWLNRQDSLMAIIRQRTDVPASAMDMMVASNCRAHIQQAWGMKKPAEANRAMAEFLKTDYSKSIDGRVQAASLLLRIERYAESADGFALLDHYYAESGIELTFDVINEYLAEKFEANYKAGRRDSALAVAAYVFDNLDSVITKQKNSTTAELATVYQTQQKDAEIAQQQISLTRQRWLGTLVALVLLTTFFIIYTWYRRRAEKRLSEAHVKLQKAYDQLEETTAVKERIESELRIARDIQMSMVPGVFPERDGLDMYAEMTPAKEVGGDLYAYVYLPSSDTDGQTGGDERLYFCVGDVSGKGVPASLFMAQSARLFRTLATEGMMPADIAYRMNNELSEGNDSNMFVTMFIGLLHIGTGQLDFCNCGHNAPVIDGHFLDMQHVNQMIGFMEGTPFEGDSINDIRGHRLLIYTDGLNEAENLQFEQFGDDRLLQVMSAADHLDSRHVIAMLKTAVEQHRDGAEPNDDLTLMCLRLQ